MLIKNKKGIEAAGFGVIAGIILVLLSAGAIIGVIRESTSKLDEKLQVDLCRISNEFKFGLQSRTKGVVSSPEVCNTIDKHSKKKFQVPSKNFKQTKGGAELETREMIKNCWYMWLDGSQANTFDKYSFSEGCFTCYTYKMKEDIKGVTFKSLENSMEEPFFVSISSDKCAKNVGGYWRKKCDVDETDFFTKETPPSIEHKCCVKGIKNECENKGGECSSTGSLPSYPRIYNEWSCPERKQSCYVKNENLYSYTRYIREFGSRGGDILFISPSGQDTDDIDFIPGEIYAVSFLSPSQVFCADSDAQTGCLASIGNNWYVPVTVVGVAATAWIVGPAALLSFLGKSALQLALFAPLATVTTGFAAYKFDLPKKALETLVSPLSAEAPNLIIVSSLDHAQELGCTIRYGG